MSLIRPLSSRPFAVRVFLAGVVPAVFGGICGWVLGVSEPVYLVLSIIGVVGGVVGGLEHHGARAGAGRGVIGGSLFGGFLLLVHSVSGEEAKALLPDPEILLLVITTVLGTAFGALGGRLQQKYGGGEIAGA